MLGLKLIKRRKTAQRRRRSNKTLRVLSVVTRPGRLIRSVKVESWSWEKQISRKKIIMKCQ